MKNKEKKVKIKVKPARQTRAERQNAKFVQMAGEELQLCIAAIEFHKAYLAVELGCEEVKFEKIKARLNALMPKGEVAQPVETVNEEELLDSLEALSEEEFSGKEAMEF